MAKESEQLSQTRRGWVFTRAALLLGGLVLVLLALAVLLLDPWSRSSAQGAPASTESAAARLEAGRLAARVEPLELAEALGVIEVGDLYSGVFRFAVALLPTPTAQPTPTPTPQPAWEPEPAAPPASEPQAPAPRPVEPAPPPPARSCPTAGMGGFAVALYDAINAERIQHGMPALGVDGCAVYVAQLRSNDMASRGYFSHTAPDGSTAFSLLDAYAVPHGWAGENLARNNYPDSESVAVAIRDLMASPGHRDNILSGHYSHLGVGFADDGAGMKYFTMVFIGPA